jgi:acyl-CoA reductase-like NAD-dependent aldehyde dehydrogenase
MNRYEHFYDGEWQAPVKGSYLEVRNPYDGQLNATFAEGDEIDVDLAVTAAGRAFGTTGWAHAAQRARTLRRYADLIDENGERLATVESRDNGKTLAEVRRMYGAVGGYFRFAASLAETTAGQLPSGADPNQLSMTTREPYGVVAIQTPWNTPGMLFAQPAASALAAGNTVVVKPSEFAPRSTLELAALAGEAGFPPGVLNVVTGLGPAVGAALSSHADVAQIVFIGSPTAGRVVAEQAARLLVPVIMELGGKSANIVFADADLDRAALGVVAGFTGASGQSCVAGTRILVERRIHDDFLARLVEQVEALRLGDPSAESTDLGPTCNRAQYERIERFVAMGLAEGARLVTGGRQPDELLGTLFYPPTIFADVTPQSTIVREEIFGPVACVLPFDDEAEAIALANDTKYGLAGGVWTRDLDRAHRMTRAIKAGTIWVNQYRSGDPAFPFGGYGHSGYGRFNGIEGYLQSTRTKSTQILLSAP